MSFKILLATDGSPYANKAADYCIDMAKKLDADVLALSVISRKRLEVFALDHHDDIIGYEDENSVLSSEAHNAVDYAADRACERDVRLTKRVMRGYPADEIMKIAKEENFDLIVVGNIGRSGIERVLLGSVTDTVVRHAPCPVLVVR